MWSLTASRPPEKNKKIAGQLPRAFFSKLPWKTSKNKCSSVNDDFCDCKRQVLRWVGAWKMSDFQKLQVVAFQTCKAKKTLLLPVNIAKTHLFLGVAFASFCKTNCVCLALGCACFSTKKNSTLHTWWVILICLNPTQANSPNELKPGQVLEELKLAYRVR